MDQLVVTVKQGTLQGILKSSVFDTQYVAFKGIPFAAPPIGELRFKDPEPPSSWEGIRDASKCGTVCSQIDQLTEQLIGSEDCLYLNIYIPNELNAMARKPVMVWIHGGAYMMGSGNDVIYQPDYLMAKDVILITINYRLGALGFLNLGHETASGNQALKDQVAALRWIKENIEAFGGNEQNITVFGNSAGAASTHFLMFSPLSKGLFHKAILHSGTSTCNWAVNENTPEVNSFRLALVLGNDSKDPEAVAKFLRSLPVEKIIEAQHNVLTEEEAQISNVAFSPTLDKKAKEPFFPRPVRELVYNDNDIPLMLGYTSHEYIMFLKDGNEKTLNVIYNNIPQYAKMYANLSDETEIMQLTERIKQWYFNDKPCTQESVVFLIQFLSDFFFKLPIKELVNIRRKKKQALTYLYKFSYVGSQVTTVRLLKNPLCMLGASHSDDMPYLFYKTRCKVNDINPPAVGTKDRKVMEAITTMWSNFARTGNPTTMLDQNVTTVWKPATPNSFNYLEINDTLKCSTITDYVNIFQESNQ